MELSVYMRYRFIPSASELKNDEKCQAVWNTDLLITHAFKTHQCVLLWVLVYLKSLKVPGEIAILMLHFVGYRKSWLRRITIFINRLEMHIGRTC